MSINMTRLLCSLAGEIDLEDTPAPTAIADTGPGPLASSPNTNPRPIPFAGTGSSPDPSQPRSSAPPAPPGPATSTGATNRSSSPGFISSFKPLMQPSLLEQLPPQHKKKNPPLEEPIELEAFLPGPNPDSAEMPATAVAAAQQQLSTSPPAGAVPGTPAAGAAAGNPLGSRFAPAQLGGSSLISPSYRSTQFCWQAAGSALGSGALNAFGKRRFTAALNARAGGPDGRFPGQPAAAVASGGSLLAGLQRRVRQKKQKPAQKLKPFVRTEVLEVEELSDSELQQHLLLQQQQQQQQQQQRKRQLSQQQQQQQRQQQSRQGQVAMEIDSDDSDLEILKGLDADTVDTDTAAAAAVVVGMQAGSARRSPKQPQLQPRRLIRLSARRSAVKPLIRRSNLTSSSMRPKRAMPHGAAQSTGRQASSGAHATAAAAANNPYSMTRLTARSPTQPPAKGRLGSSGVGAPAAANQHKQRPPTALKPALRPLRPAAATAAAVSIKRRVTFAPMQGRNMPAANNGNGSKGGSSGKVGSGTAGIASGYVTSRPMSLAAAAAAVAAAAAARHLRKKHMYRARPLSGRQILMKRSSNSNTCSMHAGSLAPAGALCDAALTATARGAPLQPNVAGPQQGRLQPVIRGLKPAHGRPGDNSGSGMAAQHVQHLRPQQRQPQVSRMLQPAVSRIPMQRPRQVAASPQRGQPGTVQQQQQQRRQHSPSGTTKSGRIMFPNGSFQQQASLTQQQQQQHRSVASPAAPAARLRPAQPTQRIKLVRRANGFNSPAAATATPPHPLEAPAGWSAALLQPRLCKRPAKLRKPLKPKKAGKQQYSRAAAALAAANLSSVQPPPPPPLGAAVTGRLSAAARTSMAAAGAGAGRQQGMQQGGALRVVQSPMSPPSPPPRLRPVSAVQPVGVRGAEGMRMQANRLQPVQLTSGRTCAGATAFSRRTAATAGSAQGIQQQHQQGCGGVSGRLQPQGQVGRGDTAVGQQVQRGAGPAGRTANRYDMDRDNSMQSPREGAFLQGIQPQQRQTAAAAKRGASPAGRIANRYDMNRDNSMQAQQQPAAAAQRGASPAGRTVNRYDMNRDDSMQSPRQDILMQGMQEQQQRSAQANRVGLHLPAMQAQMQNSMQAPMQQHMSDFQQQQMQLVQEDSLDGDLFEQTYIPASPAFTQQQSGHSTPSRPARQFGSAGQRAVSDSMMQHGGQEGNGSMHAYPMSPPPNRPVQKSASRRSTAQMGLQSGGRPLAQRGMHAGQEQTGFEQAGWDQDVDEAQVQLMHVDSADFPPSPKKQGGLQQRSAGTGASAVFNSPAAAQHRSGRPTAGGQRPAQFGSRRNSSLHMRQQQASADIANDGVDVQDMQYYEEPAVQTRPSSRTAPYPMSPPAARPVGFTAAAQASNRSQSMDCSNAPRMQASKMHQVLHDSNAGSTGTGTVSILAVPGSVQSMQTVRRPNYRTAENSLPFQQSHSPATAVRVMTSTTANSRGKVCADWWFRSSQWCCAGGVWQASIYAAAATAAAVFWQYGQFGLPRCHV